MSITRRSIFSSTASLLVAGEKQDAKKPKRILFVWKPALIDLESVKIIADTFEDMGIQFVGVPTMPSNWADGDPITMYDLDGLPAADLGKIQKLSEMTLIALGIKLECST